MEGIEKFFRRKHMDIALFFWVESTRKNLPSVSIERSIIQFVEYYDMQRLEINSLAKTYQRMQKEFRAIDASTI